MIRTNNFNETIRNLLDRERVVVVPDDERILLDREAMLMGSGFMGVEMIEEAWLSGILRKIRQRVPPYARVTTGEYTSAHVEIIVEIEKEPDAGTCDKCGQPVAENEDATHFAAILSGCNAVPFLCGKRHIRCSPSRAQFIVHPDFPEVFDYREEFDKRLLDAAERRNLEAKYTAAWVKLQEETGHAVTKETP